MMKHITLKIPENKFDFYMELFVRLGLDVTENVEISDEHKNIVRERIKEYETEPNLYYNWEDVKDSFKSE